MNPIPSALPKFIGKILTGFTLCATLALAPQSVPAADAGKGLLLVCNKGDHTLSIIDSGTGTELAAVPEDGVTGHECTASLDGKLGFVPIYGNSGVGKPGTDGQLIRVVDLEKRAVIGTIDLGKGLRPHCAVVGKKSGLIYVSTENDNSITIIDPKTLKVVGTLPTGQAEAHMFTLTSNERKAYTANVGPGTVSVVDVKTKEVIKVIPISKVTQRISITADDKWVFTADQTKPQIAVIDTAKDEVTKWIELPGIAYGTAPTPDGHFLVAALNGVNQVAIVDLKTGKVAHLIDVPKTPQYVQMRPDGLMAYVSCDASGQVAAIDLKAFKVDKLIKAGKGADGLAWAPLLK